MPATNVNWPTPLTRLNPWYPGQFGVPGTDHETGLRLNTEGTIFWVDPNHPDPNDNRDGTNPNAPFNTIAAALTHCEAYRGDTIAVMHNGFWTYADATESHVTPIQENVTINVPGVRLVGISSSSLGVPWIPSGNNQTLISVTELDVTIEGFNFWEPGAFSGTTAISAGWNSPPYGENLVVRHCYFYSLDYGITLDYSWYCYIEDCRFDSIESVAIYNPGVYGDPDYLVIRDCLFAGNASDIDLADTEYALIENNRIVDATAAITLDAGNHNQILGNTIGGNPTTAIVILTGAYNIILDNAIYADGTGTNNMIDCTGGANNLVGGNYLSCTLVQYNTTCSDATSGSWGGNHCNNGDTTAAPT